MEEVVLCTNKWEDFFLSLTLDHALSKVISLFVYFINTLLIQKSDGSAKELTVVERSSCVLIYINTKHLVISTTNL